MSLLTAGDLQRALLQRVVEVGDVDPLSAGAAGHPLPLTTRKIVSTTVSPSRGEVKRRSGGRSVSVPLSVRPRGGTPARYATALVRLGFSDVASLRSGVRVRDNVAAQWWPRVTISSPFGETGAIRLEHRQECDGAIAAGRVSIDGRSVPQHP
jgi:hypothetical protein